MTAPTSTFPLTASSRSIIGKQVRQIRNEGNIPAVVYGNKSESTSLTLSRREFVLLYRQAGTSTLVDLTVDDKKSRKVLIHDVQLDGPTGKVLHVDFFLVNMKEKLETEIELDFVGEASAVEVEGGTFTAVKSELSVECLPQDLVHSIEVDISSLVTLDDVIRIKDIKVPAGITLLDDAEDVVASIAAPRSEEEMAELDQVDTVDVSAIASETKSGTDEVTTPDSETDKK